MKQFRVAVIGCGAISGNHIAGILGAGQTICALCDILPEAAQKRAEQYGLNVPIYTDFRELLDKEKPDSIHICTPHYLHAEMIVEALGRNINVLSEKPLAISMDQLHAVLAAEKASRAQLGVCQQNRYEANMLALREIAKEHGVAAGAGMVMWKRDEAYYRSGAWRGTILQEGGGVMINQALHTLDILQWVCGMPDHVTSHIANDYHKGCIEVEDTAEATFELPSGITTHFYATNNATKDFPVQIQLITKDGKPVFATNQAILFDNALVPVAREETADHPLVGKSVWGRGHGVLIADFYRCVGEGIPFPINGEEGAKVIRLILSMYASHGNRIGILG